MSLTNIPCISRNWGGGPLCFISHSLDKTPCGHLHLVAALPNRWIGYREDEVGGYLSWGSKTQPTELSRRTKSKRTGPPKNVYFKNKPIISSISMGSMKTVFSFELDP